MVLSLMSLLGDLNIVCGNTQLKNICKSFLFEHLTKKLTCYNGDTSTSTDHIINISKRFMKSIALETGISDHHKMRITIFAVHLQRVNPKHFSIAAIKSSI